jgi:ribA/ribD-fused uncharacterized protein
MIASLKGTYLSNFYESVILHDGMLYRNAESAFQASKCTEPKDRLLFQSLLGAEAKALGKKVIMREDWNEVRLSIMWDVLQAKFAQHPDLIAKLIATGDEEIIEGNTWNDKFWGKYNGEGMNHLGIMLMAIREEAK